MDNTLLYWKKIEENERQVVYEEGDNIVNIFLLNMHTCDEYFKWIPCRDRKKLLGYIKYIVLPSLNICRKLAGSDDEYSGLIIYGVFDYEDTIEILGNIDGKKEYTDDYIEWFDIFDKMNEETPFETIKHEVEKIVHKVDESDFKRGLLFSMDLYEKVEDIRTCDTDIFEN